MTNDMELCQGGIHFVFLN